MKNSLFFMLICFFCANIRSMDDPFENHELIRQILGDRSQDDVDLLALNQRWGRISTIFQQYANTYLQNEEQSESEEEEEEEITPEDIIDEMQNISTAVNEDSVNSEDIDRLVERDESRQEAINALALDMNIDPHGFRPIHVAVAVYEAIKQNNYPRSTRRAARDVIDALINTYRVTQNPPARDGGIPSSLTADPEIRNLLLGRNNDNDQRATLALDYDDPQDLNFTDGDDLSNVQLGDISDYDDESIEYESDNSSTSENEESCLHDFPGCNCANQELSECAHGWHNCHCIDDEVSYSDEDSDAQETASHIPSPVARRTRSNK